MPSRGLLHRFHEQGMTVRLGTRLSGPVPDLGRAGQICADGLDGPGAVGIDPDTVSDRRLNP